MKNILLLFFGLWVSVTTLTAQDRVVFFVHGFSANNSAWIPVTRAMNNGAPNFPARPALTIPESYTEGVGQAVNTLQAAGDVLKLNFQRDLLPLGGVNGIRAQNAIAIAHSQGGLVARWATEISSLGGQNRENALCFGGLVTFGTPHAGAKIAESRANGNLDVFLNSGCNDFGGGIIATEIEQIKVPFQNILSLFGFNALNTVEDLKSALCNTFFSKEPTGTPNSTSFVSQRILGPMLSQGGTKSIIEDKILNDYQPNAQPLLQLNATTPITIKRLAFYGDEVKEQAFLRTMHYIQNPSQGKEPFEALDNDEEAIITTFNNSKTDLNNSVLAFENGAFLVECNLGDYLLYGLFNPIFAYGNCRGAANRASELRDAARVCRKATAWMDNSNTQWLGVIGASNPTITTMETCMCDNGAGAYSIDRRCTRREVTQGCQSETTIVVNPGIIEDNDGVALKASALAMPDKIDIGDQARMPGSQHMQMRNDPNTRDKLKALFNGDYHPYFETR